MDASGTLEADGRAVREFLRGSDAALIAELREIFALVYRRCRARLADPEEAEDVAQETLLRILSGIRGLEDGCRFRRWAGTIARRVCLDAMRRRRRRRALQQAAGAPPPPEPEPLERVLADEERRHALRALASLTPRHREVLVRRELTGESYAEIALAMGATPDVVKALLRRARLALRRSYSAISA